MYFEFFLFFFQDIIQLHISCPSDKEEEKSSKDEYENEEKEKKDKTPRKMLSRGKMLISCSPSLFSSGAGRQFVLHETNIVNSN